MREDQASKGQVGNITGRQATGAADRRDDTADTSSDKRKGGNGTKARHNRQRIKGKRDRSRPPRNNRGDPGEHP